MFVHTHSTYLSTGNYDNQNLAVFTLCKNAIDGAEVMLNVSYDDKLFSESIKLLFFFRYYRV